MKLASFIATAAAAVALASQLVGPVAAVMHQVSKRTHPAIRRFEGVAVKYRQALRWSE
jgi:hypothetical protein